MEYEQQRWAYKIMDQPMILSSIITKAIRIHKRSCLNQLGIFGTGTGHFSQRIHTVWFVWLEKTSFKIIRDQETTL